MKIGIYVVYDLVAQTIIGGLQLHKHDAPAIRTFVDAATTQGSIVQQHVEDFELRRLGFITEDTKLEEDPATILTGSQWLATQPKADTGDTVERQPTRAALSSRR